jgi:NAD(P)-dependent dehydrogenase (short-subunit alcohol dehydrogenase family)
VNAHSILIPSYTKQILTRRGIGFAIVHRLASAAPDHIYLLAMRTKNAGEKAVQKLREFGVTATLEILDLDVTCVDQVMRAVEEIQSHYGKLDGRSDSRYPPRRTF